MRDPTAYSSECDLCADFIAWSEKQGWKAYAETGGWDILLVRGDGVQLGIQAKLRLNATLLRQALPTYWHEQGPDYRGILIGNNNREAVDICGVVGLACFMPSHFGIKQFAPAIAKELDADWNPHKRCELPEYVPDVAAGASAPVQLTEWKVKALRACALLELQGFITSKEIRQIGMDPRRWIHPTLGWLKPLGEGRFGRGKTLEFPEQHPKVYAQIRDELAAKREEAAGA